VARQGHAAINKARARRALSALSFVALRPRVEEENLIPGIREWSRLKLNVALEVSEFLEVLVVASRSDLVGLIPKSMLKLARESFRLQALPVTVTTKAIPIRLFWLTARTTDPAQIFLRKQIEAASRAVTGRDLR
jgi:DNA-binding transcriptional LysR family regulator